MNKWSPLNTTYLQDSYALCRVFKKNGVCSEIEEQARQCSSSPTVENCQIMINDCDSMSLSPADQHHVSLASSSSFMDEEDNNNDDESWMQFITDDAWCSSNIDTLKMI